MSIKSSAALFCLALILSGSLLSAASEDSLVNIDLHMGEKSIFPRIAVDPATGTTAIVWTNYNTNNPLSQRVYMRFILNINNNTDWRISNRQIVSSGGEHASVAFNTNDNLFYVVWDTRRGGHLTETREIIFASEAGASRYGDIQGRFYNLKGKKASAIMTYDNQGSVGQNPLAIYNNIDNVFLLVWQWKGSPSIFSSAPRGLYVATIDNNGEQVGSAKKIRDRIHNDRGTLSIYPIEGCINSRSKRALVLVGEDVPAGSGVAGLKYFVYSLDLRGNIFSRSSLIGYPIRQASWYASITINNGTKKANHYSSFAENGTLSIRRVSKKGIATGPATKVKRAKGVWSVALSYSPENSVYLLVHDVSNGLVARYVDASGSVLKKGVKISSDNSAGRPAVAWNPIMGKFIVVWVERNATHDRVMLTTIEPPANE